MAWPSAAQSARSLLLDHFAPEEGSSARHMGSQRARPGQCLCCSSPFWPNRRVTGSTSAEIVGCHEEASNAGGCGGARVELLNDQPSEEGFPEALRAPTASPALNLGVQVIGSNIVGNDVVEVAAQYMAEHARLEMWMGSTGHPWVSVSSSRWAVPLTRV